MRLFLLAAGIVLSLLSILEITLRLLDRYSRILKEAGDSPQTPLRKIILKDKAFLFLLFVTYVLSVLIISFVAAYIVNVNLPGKAMLS